MKNLIAILCLTASLAASAKELALTVDDTPRFDSHLLGRTERAKKIRAILNEKNVPQVMFFATPMHLNEEAKTLLQNYAEDGHLIANHSHTHRSLDELGVAGFLDDTEIAHHFLKDLPNFSYFYRYPFLHRGNTAAKRIHMEGELEKMGYRDGYVTLANSDWFIDSSLQTAIKAKQNVDYQALKHVYVNHIVNQANFTYQATKPYFQHEVKHTLLIHESDTTALYLGDLIDRLRADGWTIIPALQAFNDPIARLKPKTLNTEKGRLMGLAVDRGYKGPLSDPQESLEKITATINSLSIFKEAQGGSAVDGSGEE